MQIHRDARCGVSSGCRGTVPASEGSVSNPFPYNLGLP